MQALSSRSGVATTGVASRPTSVPLRTTRVSTAQHAGTRGLSTRVQATSTPVSKPPPVVKIDNTSDAFATKVTIEFGEKGQTAELLDAIMALKNLGLNIRKAKVGQDSSANIFYLTDADTSEKIIRSARLEDIRLTIINSLVAKFPETSDSFSVKGSVSDSESGKVLGVVRKVVQTTIDVTEAASGSCSVLKITTSDRPGLLVDIVRVLKDINLNVVSAEIDTVGQLAKDEFFVTYHGEPLSSPMVTLVTNSLQYYLSLAEVAKEESY